jgi:hypothetical protein
MKPSEFVKESVDQQEYNDEAGMAKNNLHTIVRTATHLEKALGDQENLPEWVQEKISQIKGMMVTVMEYMISQHEMGKKEEIPTFNTESAYKKYEEILSEEATGGSTGAGSVSAVMTELGGSTKDLIKRQKNYTNQQTTGGAVKIKKAK